MNNTSPIVTELSFPKELINDQLQKIFSDHLFAKSEILRKFLAFIVDQTASGHANWVKEYTIAVNVLDKAADFKPQNNGIVRIHAGRLRRALNNYYNNNGSSDNIKIFIPKGRYVPVFVGMDSEFPASDSIDDAINDDKQPSGPSSSLLTDESLTVIAVLPFQHFNNDPLENSLVDGLGLQLSNALMKFKKYSVAAYYTVSDLWKKIPELSKLVSILEVSYVITGNIQRMENRIRSHIQLIDCNNGIQLCSCMYEGELNPENFFRLQDEMVAFIIAQLTGFDKLISNKKTASLASVTRL